MRYHPLMTATTSTSRTLQTAMPLPVDARRRETTHAVFSALRKGAGRALALAKKEAGWGDKVEGFCRVVATHDYARDWVRRSLRKSCEVQMCVKSLRLLERSCSRISAASSRNRPCLSPLQARLRRLPSASASSSLLPPTCEGRAGCGVACGGTGSARSAAGQRLYIACACCVLRVRVAHVARAEKLCALCVLCVSCVLSVCVHFFSPG